MTEDTDLQFSSSPTNDIILMGDGLKAQSLGARELIDTEGRKVIEFTIKPSNLLRKRHDIKNSDLNRLGNMKWKALKSDVIPMNVFDPANRWFQYKRTFLHEPTALSEISSELSRECESLRRENKIIQGENMKLAETIEIIKTKPWEFLNQSMEFQKEFASMIKPNNESKEEK